MRKTLGESSCLQCNKVLVIQLLKNRMGIATGMDSRTSERDECMGHLITDAPTSSDGAKSQPTCLRRDGRWPLEIGPSGQLCVALAGAACDVSGIQK